MNDWPSVVIAIGLIASVIAILFAYAAAQSQKLDDTYVHLARHYRGNCKRGGMFGLPSAEFYDGSLPVQVDIHSTGGKHPTFYTQVHLRWPDVALRCEISPEGFFNRVGKFLGMQDIEIGDADFDNRFILTSSNPAALKAFLSPEVRDIICKLQRVSGSSHIYLSIHGGRFVAKKLGKISGIEPLKEMVELSLAIYHAANPQMVIVDLAAGIEFDNTNEQSRENIICQICGEAIESDLVFCRRCKTPHHQDCWNYYGACSIYGCGEMTFTKHA